MWPFYFVFIFGNLSKCIALEREDWISCCIKKIGTFQMDITLLLVGVDAASIRSHLDGCVRKIVF